MYINNLGHMTKMAVMPIYGNRCIAIGTASIVMHRLYNALSMTIADSSSNYR